MAIQAPPPRVEGDSESRARAEGYVCVDCDQVLGLSFHPEQGRGLVHDTCPRPR